MLFKDVLNASNLTHFATWGLVIFVAVFLLVTLWTLTRPRRTVQRWSAMALDRDEATTRVQGHGSSESPVTQGARCD